MSVVSSPGGSGKEECNHINGVDKEENNHVSVGSGIANIEKILNEAQ